MTPQLQPRPTRVVGAILALLSVLGLVVGLGAPASAGGWAVASLDDVPAPTAGETSDIGFRILQHGVTPVDLTDDVGIEVVGSDGTTTYFPAVLDGPTGHYVATVTFPDAAGSYMWTVHMGWFGPQQLGSIDVAAPTASAADVATEADTAAPSVWSVARWVVLGAAVVLAGLAISDFVSSRRRRGMAVG